MPSQNTYSSIAASTTVARRAANHAYWITTTVIPIATTAGRIRYRRAFGTETAYERRNKANNAQ